MMTINLLSFREAEKMSEQKKILGWQSCLVNDIREHILRKNYPCVFTRSGYDKDHLMVCFIQDPFQPSGIAQGFEGVRQFVQLVEQTPNPHAAALKTLMLCVDCTTLTANEQEHAMWTLLKGFLTLDTSPWPTEIPTDPENPDWAYCLFAKRAFITTLSPSHKVRHSRNIGSHMVLLYQLRDGIEFVAPYNAKGNDVREVIRQRIEAYDEVPLAPDMTTHGEGGNKDWTQYWLGDGMDGKQGECPLGHKA